MSIDPTEPLPRVVAGRFRLVRELARGGMGAVYEAERLDVGGPCALKMLLPSAAEHPRLRAYFENEARHVSRIDSDHVTQVYAAGIDEASGEPWIAMEMLRGETLEARLKRGALAPAEAWDVLRQAGHALAAAHRVGIVHCDIKPANFFLSRRRGEGDGPMVEVMDFGIARVIRENQSSALGTTRIGTPHFMAPEQGLTDARIKPATDVWALAMLAFHMLTGGDYWPGETLMAVLLQVQTAQIVAASARARALRAENRL